MCYFGNIINGLILVFLDSWVIRRSNVIGVLLHLYIAEVRWDRQSGSQTLEVQCTCGESLSYFREHMREQHRDPRHHFPASAHFNSPRHISVINNPLLRTSTKQISASSSHSVSDQDGARRHTEDGRRISKVPAPRSS